MKVILGLIYLMSDFFMLSIKRLIDFLILPFKRDKKENEFLIWYKGSSFFISFFVFMLVFYIVAQFSIIAGLVVALIVAVIESINRHGMYQRSYDEEPDISGFMVAGGTSILFVLIVSLSTAYTYKTISSYVFQSDDFKNNMYVDMVKNGKEIKVNVQGCYKKSEDNSTALKMDIIEETLPFGYFGFKYLNTNLYAECSTSYKHYRELKELK